MAVLGTRPANRARSVRAGSCDSFLINCILKKAKDGIRMAPVLSQPAPPLGLGTFRTFSGVALCPRPWPPARRPVQVLRPQCPDGVPAPASALCSPGQLSAANLIIASAWCPASQHGPLQQGDPDASSRVQGPQPDPLGLLAAILALHSLWASRSSPKHLPIFLWLHRAHPSTHASALTCLSSTEMSPLLQKRPLSNRQFLFVTLLGTADNHFLKNMSMCSHPLGDHRALEPNKA